MWYSKPKERCLLSEKSCYKANADGVFHSATRLGGGGVILRNHHGGFIAGVTNFVLTLSMLKTQNSLHGERSYSERR